MGAVEPGVVVVGVVTVVVSDVWGLSVSTGSVDVSLLPPLQPMTDAKIDAMIATVRIMSIICLNSFFI